MPITQPHVQRPEARGETALRASLLDALGEAVVGTDLDGHIIYWNRAAESLFGWTAADAIGADVRSLLVPEGGHGDADAILRGLRAGRPWSGDVFVKHRGGHSFPVQVTTTPLRNGRGQVIGGVGVSRDLSAQRQAEEALRETRERLELVHRAAASVIWEWDLDTGEFRWNDAAADTFGYPAEEVEDSVDWWEDRLHPDDAARVLTTWSTAMAEGRRFWTEEYRFRRGDGTYATVFDRAYLATDAHGRAIRVVGTMMDLTERRRAHDAARFLAQASMLLDLSLDYESSLPSVARLATQSVADACLLVVGSPQAIEHISAVAADALRQEPLDRIAARLATGGLGGTLTQRVMRSGGSVLLPAFSPALLADAELDPELGAAVRDVGLTGLVLAPITARGQTLGAVVFGRCDGSPRPAEQDVLLAEELGRRVGLAVDNARLFHSAELARRAKTDFLSVVSHELRTPLTAVMGYADLLMAEIAGGLNTPQRHQVDRIRAGADKLLRVIEAILAYARLETGRERAQIEKVALERLLERVRDVIAPQAKEREITFEEDVVDAPELLHVDLDKTAHILISLLGNAVKFSGRGGRCALRIAIEGEQLLFDVSDTGPGVQLEHVPHLFNPFWQAEQPEVRRAGGPGLGLSVARRLARLMGGEVELLDTSAHGTTFRVTLPARGSA